MASTAEATDVRVIERIPGKVSGRPVFPGTRVPIRALFDVLMAGESLDDFLEGFPSVTREQAVNVLRYACQELDVRPMNEVTPAEHRPQEASAEYLRGEGK